MPGMFDTWQGPLPSEMQAAQAAQRQQQMIPSPPSQKGLYGANALGQAVAARRAAKQEEQRAGIFNTAWDQVVQSHAGDEGGVNLPAAEVEAYQRAYTESARQGNAALAREFLDRAIASQKALDAFNLEAGKVDAQRRNTSAETYRLEDALRTEVDAQLKDTNTVVTQLNNLEEQLTLSTPAGDIGAVFALMKIFDPTSVVRESEFRTVEEAREGLLAHFAGNTVEGIESLNVNEEAKARLESFLRNTRFTDITRAQMLDSGRAAAKDRITQARAIVSDAQQTARARPGFNVESITSGTAHNVLDTEIEALRPEQIDAIIRGRVPLRDVLAGRLTNTPLTPQAVESAPVTTLTIDLSGLSDEDRRVLGR